MQRIISLILCIAAFSTSLFAGDFRLGVKVGPSFSNNLFFESVSENETNVGVVTGVHFGIGNAKLFEFQPEILFYQKGSENYGNDYTRNYLDFPLLFKWNFSPVDAVVRGNAYVGPYFSVLLTAETESGLDIRDIYSPLDGGVAFGGGIGIKAGPGRILLDFRSTIGAVPLFDLDTDEYVINQSFAIMSGYAFEF